MIVRSWSASATPTGTESYIAHFRQKVLPALQRIPGNRGALVLRRDAGTAVALTVLTFWDSMDSIREFAGPDPDDAVVDDEARAVLTAFDSRVQHFDLVIDARR